MTDLDKRIQLAGAMRWTEIDSGAGVRPYGVEPAKNGRYLPIPNPFTNANDDYAVLERMRADYRWGHFKEALIELWKMDVPWHGSQYTWNYKIGDYARAAFKVLCTTENIDGEAKD